MLHSYYTILPNCSTHPEMLMYLCTPADRLAMHVVLYWEKQEVLKNVLSLWSDLIDSIGLVI